MALVLGLQDAFAGNHVLATYQGAVVCWLDIAIEKPHLVKLPRTFSIHTETACHMLLVLPWSSLSDAVSRTWTRGTGFALCRTQKQAPIAACVNLCQPQKL